MSEQSNEPQPKNLEPPVVSLTAADPNIADWTAPSVLPLVAILGLVFLASFFAGLMVLEIWIVNEVQIRPRPFIVFSMVIQTMLIPPMICYSFLVATIMFWYGSITLRFLGAFSAVFPCVTVFCVMFYWLDNPPRDFVSDVAICLFACLLSSAAVALLYQMWTRWSLTHDRNNTDLPPTGIRSIIELTVICAVAAAFFSGAEIGDVAMGIAFFSIWGLLATLAVIRIQISFLQDADRDWLGITVGCAFVFLVCLGVNYFLRTWNLGKARKYCGTALISSGLCRSTAASWSLDSWPDRFIGSASVVGDALINRNEPREPLTEILSALHWIQSPAQLRLPTANTRILSLPKVQLSRTR